MIKNNLVFDLGFHNGIDTEFYLKKGFDVVAIEANPKLVKEGLKKFKSEIKSGKLTILNKVVSDKIENMNFYIHKMKSDWSSCFKVIAESDGSISNRISVESININELFHEFGVPYYMKVDIEGCDSIVAKQLFVQEKPKFVSFEISRKDYFEIFSWLYVSGYTKFQLRNQMNNPEYSSGEFAKFLPENKWISYDELLTRYIKYKDLKIIDNVELGLGWIDVHANME